MGAALTLNGVSQWEKKGHGTPTPTHKCLSMHFFRTYTDWTEADLHHSSPGRATARMEAGQRGVAVLRVGVGGLSAN